MGVIQMGNDITIMIISTIPDMFAEHHYFIKNVFPELKEICRSYDVNLEYIDLIFSMSEEELAQCRSIRKYFESIDMDRTFFICFRGQKLGCAPTYRNVDKLTLDKYPELVDYIGDISFTELMIMHALHPFKKHDGECGYECMPPVKHSMFYFRNDKFLDDLNHSQKDVYISNGIDEDEFVRDLKLAMAKDLVFNDKREFDSKDNDSNINIQKYDGIWDENSNLRDMVCQYTREYADLKNLSYDDLMQLLSGLNLDNQGSFIDFKCENKDLKDIIIEDFLNELKLELE